MADTFLRDQAIAYALGGWRVLPIHWVRADGECSCDKENCEFIAKHPIAAHVPHGVKNATRDIEVISEWWLKNPKANIGIATGDETNLLVVDIDADHGGNETVQDLAAQGFAFPDTVTATTGGGGEHRYYTYPQGKVVNNSAGTVGVGIDIRAQAGYVLAPPSINAKGPYTWDLDQSTGDGQTLTVPTDPPAWLLEKLEAKSMHSHFEMPEVIRASGRNNFFTAAAGRMRRSGFSYDAILAALEEERIVRCEQPLGNEFTHAELAKIVSHVVKYEPSDPISSIAAEAPEGLQLVSMRQMVENPPPPKSWVWDRLLNFGGTSMLVAKPKVGKSTLARSLMRRLVEPQDDELLLGRSLKHGPVVYISLEDQEIDVIDHFRMMGLSSEGMDRLFIHSGRAPDQAYKALKHLENAISWVDRHCGMMPVLVVIDTLQEYARIRDINSYNIVVESMTQYSHLARDANVHIMFVHHANRSEGNPGDNIMGSTALFGKVDTLLDYRSKEGIRTLCSVNRSGAPLPETSISLDAATMDVVAAGSYEEHMVRGACESVMQCIGDSVFTEAEVVDRCNGHTRQHVFSALMLLVKEGRLQQGGAGRRADPHTYTVPAKVALSQFPSWEQTEFEDGDTLTL
jgi:hypothetical protein